MANFGFLLTEQTMKSMQVLNDEDFRKTLMALYNYNCYDMEPTDLNELGTVIFEMTKPYIDYQKKKWIERGSEVNRKNNIITFK